MLEGKPTIVLSYSGRYEDRLAKPVAQGLRPYGLRPVLVGQEPLPAGVESTPNTKVEWFFRQADMAVFLATPDDRLESGDVYTRPNIIDEHRLGQQLDHLSRRLLVFKSPEVTLPSNINPVYERLPLDDLDWILGRIVDQARTWGVLPASAEQRAEAEPESSDEAILRTELPGGDDPVAGRQAIAAIGDAVEALRGDRPERTQLERAELAITGLIADAGGADTLGVHLANRLFARRHDIQPRAMERLLLIRTYLSHSRDENVPGVFWIHDLPRRQLIALMSSLARDDGDPEVQTQALTILGKLGAPASVDEARHLLLPSLASGDFRRRWAALDFLRVRRDRRLRDLLDDPQLLDRDRHRASQTGTLLDLGRRPSDVMARYVADAYVRSAAVERALLAAARRVRRDVVLAALDSQIQEVRLLGVRMAGEKRILSLSLARGLIDRDRSPKVRLAIVSCLLETGAPVDFEFFDRATAKRDGDLPSFTGFEERQALEVDIALRLPMEDLRAQVQWTTVHGPASYEALGLRNEEWVESHVRRDLRNDFAALKDAGRAKMLKEYLAVGEEKAGRALAPKEKATVVDVLDKHWKEWGSEERLGAFMTRLFQRAALRILAARGRRTDVQFARRFAESSDQDLRVEAIRLFARFGTAHDAATAVTLANRVYGDDHRQQAGEVAVRLAYKKDKLDIVKKLRTIHTLRVWAVSRLAEVHGGVDEAWKLLRSDDGDVRTAAATVVWDAIDPRLADGLLSYYMEGQHFYNVVRAIDRRLNAPEWLRDALPS